MSLELAQAWIERLSAVDAADLDTGLSPEGARAAWSAALDALTPEALRQAVLAGEGFETATFVAARTVFTAPVEWLAVLLARGTRVRLKPPSDAANTALKLADVARAVGLPLTVDTARGALDAELVVAMGSDETITEIGASLSGDSRFLGFGHRWSAAVIRLDDPEVWAGVALDAALHDGRGCMSPVVVLTTLPFEAASRRLASALEAVQRRLPRGEIDPSEAANIRARRALARATGGVVEGEGWSIHGIPPDLFKPMALPRSVALVTVREAQVSALLADPRVSTVGVDASAVLNVPGARICAPGWMQRPPLIRLHDGVDWIRATARP